MLCPLRIAHQKSCPPQIIFARIPGKVTSSRNFPRRPHYDANSPQSLALLSSSASSAAQPESSALLGCISRDKGQIIFMHALLEGFFFLDCSSCRALSCAQSSAASSHFFAVSPLNARPMMLRRLASKESEEAMGRIQARLMERRYSAAWKSLYIPQMQGKKLPRICSAMRHAYDAHRWRPKLRKSHTIAHVLQNFRNSSRWRRCSNGLSSDFRFQRRVLKMGQSESILRQL